MISDGIISDAVQWRIQLITTIDDLNKMDVCFEFGCDEIQNSSYKETQSIWNITDTSTINVDLAKMDNQDNLSFFIDIEVICYKHPTSNKWIYPGVSPVFHSKFAYKWIIDNTKCNKGDYLRSDDFMDGCFAVYCTPKGDIDDTGEESVTLGIEIHKIPYTIGYLECIVKVESNIAAKGDEDTNDMIDIPTVHKIDILGYIEIATGFKVKESMQFDDERIEIKVLIEILNIYDETNIKLEKSKWSEYGITI